MHYFDKPVHAKTYEDKKWRVEEFKLLRSKLKKNGFKVDDLIKVMEITKSTYKQYPSIKNNKIPTIYSLERLRSVLENKINIKKTSSNK